MATRRVPLVIPLVTSLLLVGTAIVLAAQMVALTADGSYFLVRVIEDEALFGPPGRIFAEAARQFPVLVMVWAGETDAARLAIAHGVGQLVLPALLWCAAIVLARHDRTAFFAVASTAALSAGGTWLFSVSENVLAVPLTVLLAVLLWLPRWRWPHAALGGICALLLVSSYETAALIGVAFTGWAIVRAHATSSRLERSACVGIAVAAVSSVVVAFVGASGRGPGPTHAGSFLYYLVSLEPWPFYVGWAGVVAIVAAVDLSMPRAASLSLLTAGAVLLGLGAVATDTAISAGYEARSGTSAASFALLLYLWWRWTRMRWGGEQGSPTAASAWIALVPLAVAALISALLLGASRHWDRQLDAFRAAVTSNTGIVTADEAVPKERAGALWDWTSVYLSLVVRSAPDDAVLVDRSPSYVPFTPQEARERFPDRYTWR